LPVASQSQVIDKDMPILRIEKGLFYLNDKVVTSQALGLRLTELKEKLQQEQKESGKIQVAEKPNIELMIQADTEMAFSDLDPLIKASSLAGIEKLRFAVVPPR
jgi:biopolymer transport protein ExbD